MVKNLTGELTLEITYHGFLFFAYTDEARWWIDNVVTRYGERHHAIKMIMLFPEYRGLAEPLRDYLFNAFQVWVTKQRSRS